MISDLRKILADLDALAAECDSAQGAHEMVLLLDDVMRKDFRMVRATWDAKRKELLGSTRLHVGGGQHIFQADSYKYDWDHDLIASKAQVRALYTDEGERDDDIEAVASRGIEMMRQLYVTPSVKPRSEGLKLLGFETKEAAASKRTKVGTEVKTYIPKRGNREQHSVADLDDGDD